MISLEEILEAKKMEIDRLKVATPLSELQDRIKRMDTPRDFCAGLKPRNPGVIAEIKRCSPSQGIISGDFDHRTIAREYEEGGASALSVLTDQKFFQGDPSYIAETREVAALPVLRKDFVLDEYQVFESRALHADAILLIVRAMDQPQLERLHSLAYSLGLAVLVEVHDERDLAIANTLKAKLIGINNRDLSDYSVSLERSLRLRDKVHADALVVSESGIKTAADIEQLAGAGFHGVLIGESLMRAHNKPAFLRGLLRH
ncbi:MAG: indole-3-glycerol phosphate synthase TrpC [Bacteroidota bacterium]